MRPRASAFLLLLGASAGGCALGEAGGDDGRAGFLPPGLPSTELVAGDPVLARSVSVVGVETARRGGVLAVSFRLGNRSEDLLRFEYRFEWTDAEGLRIDPPAEAWTPVVLPPLGSAPVRGTAPGEGATRWSLRVRAIPGGS